jgi:hypothetical protein
VNLANHTLKAPFSGVVTRAPATAGGVIGGSGSEFALSDLSQLKLVGTLGETDAPLVKLGSEVEIDTDRGQVLAKVSSLLGAVDVATRRVPFEATVDNRGPNPLLANVFVRGRVRGGAAVQVLRLPRAALKGGAQDVVMVVAGGALHERRVVFVSGPDGTLLVRAGLGTDEQVMLDPPAEARDGEPVTIVPSDPKREQAGP